MITPHKVHSILRNKMALKVSRDYLSTRIGANLSLIARFDEGDQIIIDTLKRNGVEATFDGGSVIVNLEQT